MPGTGLRASHAHAHRILAATRVQRLPGGPTRSPVTLGHAWGQCHHVQGRAATGVEWVKAKNVVKHPTMQGQPQTKRSTELRLQGPALQVGTALIPILQRRRLRLRVVKCPRPQSRFTRVRNQTWAAGCRAWAALTLGLGTAGCRCRAPSEP